MLSTKIKYWLYAASVERREPRILVLLLAICGLRCVDPMGNGWGRYRFPELKAPPVSGAPNDWHRKLHLEMPRKAYSYGETLEVVLHVLNATNSYEKLDSPLDSKEYAVTIKASHSGVPVSTCPIATPVEKQGNASTAPREWARFPMTGFGHLTESGFSGIGPGCSLSIGGYYATVQAFGHISNTVEFDVKLKK